MYRLEQETIDLLRTLPPDLADQYLDTFYLLGKIPGRSLVDVNERLLGLIPPDEAEAWAPFWAPDPISFGRNVLGLEPTAIQRHYGLDYVTNDQIKVANSVLRHKRTLVKSCNGGGKTWLGGLIALWAHNAGFRTLITASTLEQADAGVGAEIRRMVRKGPPGLSGHWMPSETRANFSELHELVTFSVKIGTLEEIAGSAAGRHYQRMCFIIDEANSVNAKLLEQVDRICLSPHDIVLALMNPTPPTCAMRKISEVVHDITGPLWNVETINGEQHPNVVFHNPDIIPGAISEEMIQAQLAKAGGNRKHFLFAPPVLGEYADSSSEQLIPRDWIERSMVRWEHKQRKKEYRGKVLFNDIASTGGDASSLWACEDHRLFMPMIPESFVNTSKAKEDWPTLKAGPTWLRGRSTNHSVDMIRGTAHFLGDVRAIALDSGGLGEGPTDQLRSEWKKLPTYTKYVPDKRLIQKTVEIRPFVATYKFKQAPIKPASRKFKKFKDQLLWSFREAFRLDLVDIPPQHVLTSYGIDADVMEELCRPIWGEDATGHLVVCDKRDAEVADDQMRERAAQMPASSPNELHAMAGAWWQWNKMPTGPRPLQDNREMHVAKMEAVKKAEVERHLGKKKRKKKLPWQR